MAGERGCAGGAMAAALPWGGDSHHRRCTSHVTVCSSPRRGGIAAVAMVTILLLVAGVIAVYELFRFELIDGIHMLLWVHE